ncbi:MAG: helix-turn-helix domain-containing protein [Candidatus Omnitrophica bacterium]|nr:helix-turn-helix domain-containing protein [Candidatus Omnitrophota bacterium]MCM8802945.1 helix-turn-helix domain-containing protein [Candidatus Omnitrophota bacterium]
MDLKSLSELLRREREKRGLDYEKIYKDTMILSKFLEYAENGKWEMFPSEFHKRAVLKKYIEYLKIEGINLDDIFKKKDNLSEKEVEKDENLKQEVTNKIDRKFYIIILLFIIFSLFFIIVNLMLKNLSE